MFDNLNGSFTVELPTDKSCNAADKVFVTFEKEFMVFVSAFGTSKIDITKMAQEAFDAHKSIWYSK